MRARQWLAVGFLGVALAAVARAQEPQSVRGKVLDAAGNPAAGVEIAPLWMAEAGRMRPTGPATTDGRGEFVLQLQLQGFGKGRTLLALDRARRTGGLALVEPKDAGRPVTIKLAPLVHVHGRFVSRDLGRPVGWTNVIMSVPPMQGYVMQCASEKSEFSFRLPPGKYRFWGYGSDITRHREDLTLAANRPDVDLGAVDVPATVIARYTGKVPPAWNVTDARGLPQGVKLADLKGKWVLIEFWGFW